MSITTKIIITDTNIITDLYNAGVLEEFVVLDNVYISDIIFRDEINDKTGNIEIISKMKTVEASAEQLLEMQQLSLIHKKLSNYDLINYIIARDNNYVLATGDNLLKSYAEENGVEVIRTLKIIRLMKENNVISDEKAIKACKLLIESKKTRIPKEYIIGLLDELESESVCE